MAGSRCTFILMMVMVTTLQLYPRVSANIRNQLSGVFNSSAELEKGDSDHLKEPRVVQINLKAHTTSVDVIFLRISEWSFVTNFPFTIKEGTTHGGAELCSADTFSCTTNFPNPCMIKSGDYCDPLPSCTDIFVQVNGNGKAATATIKTLCDPVTTTPATTITTPDPTDPNVEVSTSSDSVTVTWFRKGPFSDVEDFHISIMDVEILNLNDQIDIRTEQCSVIISCTNPQCYFDSKTECPGAVFTSCSKVTVIVEDADGANPQPPVTAEIAPDSPSEISVELSGQDVKLVWTLPTVCQIGSRLNVTLEEDEIVDEVLGAPTHTYRFSSDSDMDCDIGMATVTAIGADGESEETSVEFLLQEMKSLKVYRTRESTIEVTWENSICVKKMNFTWYDGSPSQENYIDSIDKDVASITKYTINNVGSYKDVTVCVIPKTYGTLRPGWLEGGSQCVVASGPDIECYSCIGCPRITSSTTVEVKDGNQSCFTAVYGIGDLVSRGISDLHPDGHCELTDYMIYCYCNGHLCNNMHALQ